MNVTRLAELNSELNRIVDVIIREYNPIKIILYGSIPSGISPMGMPDKALAEKALNYAEDIVNFCKSICI